MVIHWSLSGCKSPQMFRTSLSILAHLNNVVVWMVSIRSPVSTFSCSPFLNLLEPFQVRHLQLALPSPSRSSAFLVP